MQFTSQVSQWKCTTIASKPNVHRVARPHPSPNEESLVKTRFSGRLPMRSYFLVAGAGFGTLPVVFNLAAWANLF
jgi:hypothetical protein